MDKIKAYIERGRKIEAKGLAAWKAGDYVEAGFAADHAVRHHARLLDALEEAVNIVERLSGFIHDDRCSGGHTASDCFKEDAAPIAAILEGEK